jgi:hypothetical protein
MVYDIPGNARVELKTVILDLNGTLSVGGNIVEGAKQRLAHIKYALDLLIDPQRLIATLRT